MGPTPFSVGDARKRVVEPLTAEELQWGQRHSALETDGHGGLHALPAAASMGPTPFSVGDKSRGSTRRRANSSFNGANAIQRWRQITITAWQNGADLLQWGQRHSALETTGRRGYKRQPERLQWGQRHSALETTPRCFRPISARDSFNGANAIQRWRRVAAPRPRSGVGELQWGQRHSALETRRPPVDKRIPDHRLQWGQRHSALETAFLPCFRRAFRLF